MKTNWQTHTVRISKSGEVTLRNKSGRAVAWCGGSKKHPDASAADWLQTFPGSTLDDQRK